MSEATHLHNDRQRADGLALVLGAAAVCLGGAVMLGWVLHVPVLIQVLPHRVPMQMNTAFCLALCGASLTG